MAQAERSGGQRGSATVAPQESTFGELLARQRSPEADAFRPVMRQHLDRLRQVLPPQLRGSAEQLAQRAVLYLETHRVDGFDPLSFLQVVLTAAEVGLPIDGRLAHAVPFGDKHGKLSRLVFFADYKGLLAVARRAHVIRDAVAYVVREGDEFTFSEDERGQHFEYRPGDDRGDVRGAIAILTFPDGSRHCEWLGRDDLDRIARAGKTQSVRQAWPDEMRKKDALRRALKTRVADDLTFQRALELDDQATAPAPRASPIVHTAPRTAPTEQAPPPRAVPIEQTAVAVRPAVATDDSVRQAWWERWLELRAGLSVDQLTQCRKAAGVERIAISCTAEQLEAVVTHAEALSGGGD